MTVKFFAQLKAHAGCEEVEIALSEPVGADELWALLDKRFPGIARHASSTRLACNCVYAPPEALFSEGDEVALIPPVSGG